MHMGAHKQGQGVHLPPWKCCKVFCALVVTVKTCILRVTTKKSSTYFEHQKVHPEFALFLEKNHAGAHGQKTFINK